MGITAYLAVFIAFAVDGADRALYLTRIRELLRRRDTVPALAGGR
jgi:hypothetical protein